MKTAEFKREIEKHAGYTVEFEDEYVQVKDDGRLVASVRKYSERQMTVFTALKDSSDEIFDLVVEYARTPIEHRMEERTWVIPWGKDGDGDERAWTMSEYGPDIADPGVHDWRKKKVYRFTDSQVDELKANQTPAVAKAIDIVKELVTDD